MRSRDSDFATRAVCSGRSSSKRARVQLAEAAQLEAAAELVAAVQADPSVDAMVAAAVELSRERAAQLVDLLRGTLLAGAAHRRIGDALAAFREHRPDARAVGVAALAGVGEEDHGEQLSRTVEATLAGLLADAFGG